MPNWGTKLPEVAGHHGFELRRTPADGALKGLVTSETLLVCPTHYWGGRTVPCEAPECQACQQMSPVRTHCYLAAVAAGTHEHFLFECTATAGASFQDYFDAHGTLRGCLFIASRPKRRRNAKVEIICKPYDLTTVNLPKAPDIPKAMAVIWQLPGAAITAKEDISGLELLDQDARIIAAQRTNELYAPPLPPKPNGKTRPCTADSRN